MQTAKGSPYRLTPNLFGVAFGTAGLAQCWAVAADTVSAPQWPANALWIASAAVWALVAVTYLRNITVQGRLFTELPDPVMGPFTALGVITPMPLGIALAGYARSAGETVFAVALVLTVLLGSWLTGVWIRGDTPLAQWHPAYFLPTAAGGLIAAAGCAALGWDTAARLMFGYGLVSWLVLGSIVLVRLFTQPSLPPPLIPTIAIELAPPVVAGNAWFAINGADLSLGAEILAGYAVLMALVQLSMASAYVRAPFGPGHWAFAFSYAAAVANGLLWLGVEHVRGQKPVAYVLLAVATCAWAALMARTLLGLSRRTFLLRLAPPPAAAS
ncbi:TDT family transporter [Streptomyces sp. NBC_00433]